MCSFFACWKLPEEQAFVWEQWQTPLGQSAHHDLLPTCTSPAPAQPSSQAQGHFAAPGLSLLWDRGRTSKRSEVLVSEKSLNTNMKAFGMNYPLSYPLPKTSNQTTHTSYAKNPLFQFSQRKSYLGRFFQGKALIPMSQHDATTTDVCLPLHTHRTICKYQMCLGHPRGLAALPSLSWNKPPTVTGSWYFEL